MNMKFFVTLAILAACIFAVSAEQSQNAREKRFPYIGGYGAYPYFGYGVYPYSAGYGYGYGLGYGYGGYYGGAYPYTTGLYHY